MTGVWPSIRIGGTTQDRARYDASTSAYVVYAVASPDDAPSTLTFGPAFMTLAGTYGGSVVVGLNRGKNNLTNTITAAKVAVREMENLLALELGNEPECEHRTYSLVFECDADRLPDYKSDGQPIAAGTWNPSTDAASQNIWDVAVGRAVDMMDIIQAGNSNSLPPTWGAAELVAKENATVKRYVLDYAHHNYPGGTVTSLMSHSGIVRNIRQFDSDIAAARGQGKPYIFGETNSGKCKYLGVAESHLC
jgi:hypothetical protein